MHFYENDAKEKKEAEYFSFFTKLDQMSRVGSRDRHSRWRSKEVRLFKKEFYEEAL